MIWNFDPVAFSVFGLDIRWYGLVYLGGFLMTLYGGYFLQQKMLEKPFSKKDFENLVFGTFFSGVLGGRIGHFLFYNFEIFWKNPLEIFQVWNGGMSIHGGILGAIIFIYIFTRRQKRSFFEASDVLVLPLAITLIFGRFANFINGELVGMPTQKSWGVVFPHIDDQPRHPTQIYESLKNVFLSGGLSFFYWFGGGKKRGFFTGFFLIGYGVLRFIIEFWKDIGWTFVGLNAGQWLCIVMIVGGGWIMMKKE